MSKMVEGVTMPFEVVAFDKGVMINCEPGQGITVSGEEEKLKQEQEQNNQQTQDSQVEQNQNGTITLKPDTSAQQTPQENKPQTILVP
jgi:hypothetical protein